jgi:hypothetical protein
MKTKAICFGVLAMVITIGFALLCMDSGQIRLLSDAQLLKLQGGAVLCDEDCMDSYCKCETHLCEDMECSPCQDLNGRDYYCKGRDDNEEEVLDCWKTVNRSDSCTRGEFFLTDCKADKYSSTDEKCERRILQANMDFYANDCT